MGGVIGSGDERGSEIGGIFGDIGYGLSGVTTVDFIKVINDGFVIEFGGEGVFENDRAVVAASFEFGAKVVEGSDGESESANGFGEIVEIAEGDIGANGSDLVIGGGGGVGVDSHVKISFGWWIL